MAESTKVTDQTRSIVDASAVTNTVTATFSSLTRAIYVGTAGDLVVRFSDGGSAVTISDAANGYHPLQVAQIDATGTTADGILACF